MATILKKNIGETCLICGETKKQGIHIFNQLICDSCEKEIVETNTDDVRYQEYIEKLSKLTEPIINSKKTHFH